MSEFVAKQATLAGLRNERKWQVSNWLDRFLGRMREVGRKAFHKLTGADKRVVSAVMRRSQALEALSQADLEGVIEAARVNLRLDGITQRHLVEAFAVVRECSRRALGMSHHHTQIRLSLALLRGCIAEMATGEGKTLAATMATSTAGMAGIPVHVVTVNDYLAERDAQETLPLYEMLGLSVGIISNDKEFEERKDAYKCDVCYCSNKELVFDYLKDRLILDGRENVRVLQAAMLTGDVSWSSRLMLRGLHFAVIDEADSVLIDEARTPLIISGEEKFGRREEALLRNALEIAAKMQEGDHFLREDTSALRFTKQGYEFLGRECEEKEGLWQSPFYREPLVKQALAALHVYHNGKDYIVDEEGAVQIVDPHTGRVMPGRSWGQGLQQMIEIKDGCELTRPRETSTEISYQNFFRKYHHLSGMTGTGSEVAGELLDVYRLRDKAIPLLKKSLRRRRLAEVCPSEESKWQRVVEVTREITLQGQAVLIGTNSVSSSEAISEVLTAEKIAHSVLNARQDKEEAEIVAGAGRSGAVTVATSMAGRGTDIKLTDETREAGGLHVIVSELHDASRIDRQFEGRCARQGDPGTVSHILSLEDRLVQKMSGPILKRILRSGVALPMSVGARIQRRCQKKIEAIHKRQRMQLIKTDTQRQKTMAFAGDGL